MVLRMAPDDVKVKRGFRGSSRVGLSDAKSTNGAD